MMKAIKAITGGLKSHTTKVGLLVGAGVIGNALVTVSQGGPIDWKDVLLGGAVALVGALSKAQNEPAQ